MVSDFGPVVSLSETFERLFGIIGGVCIVVAFLHFFWKEDDQNNLNLNLKAKLKERNGRICNMQNL